MTWRIIRVPSDRRLVTTDNPAFFFDAFGLGSEESELTFPLDSRSALLGNVQGEPYSTMVLDAKAALAKEICRRVVSGAERFVFAPVRAKWIETLARRRIPFLSRIGW